MNETHAAPETAVRAAVMRMAMGGSDFTPAPAAPELTHTPVVSEPVSTELRTIKEPEMSDVNSQQENIHTLKKPIEWGGKRIDRLIVSEDVSPQMLEDIDLDNLSKVGELTKAIAAITCQPVELIGQLHGSDWAPLARRAGDMLGNFLRT